VRNLFRDARRAAPCVLILDDADDLLPDRNTVQGGVASAERAVVNEFLQQLQGMRGRLEGVLVILTTNRFKELDKAAKERLAMHLRIPYPPEDQIGEILEALAEELDFDLSEVRDELIARFQRTIAPVKTPVRAVAEENHFSPREMQQAMRLLEGWDDKHQLGQRYRPRKADLERMGQYYDQLGRLLAESNQGK
jgi:SpoVK/Ycf46/Vps4 family AAA+-type ATPase